MKFPTSSAVLAMTLGLIGLGTLRLPVQAALPPAMERPVNGQEFTEGRRGRIIQKIIKKLELTPAQVAVAKSLRDQILPRVKPVFQQVRVKRQELVVLWRSSTLDPKQLEAKVTELRRLQQQIVDAKVEFVVGMSGVLTPLQRLKVEEFLRRHRRGRGRAFGGDAGVDAADTTEANDDGALEDSL